MRLDRFFDDQKIKKIIDIPIENKDCRFIHDVMAFFRFIIDYSKNLQNNNNLEKRIRKMLYDFKDSNAVEEMNEKLTILKFNLTNQE